MGNHKERVKNICIDYTTVLKPLDSTLQVSYQGREFGIESRMLCSRHYIIWDWIVTSKSHTPGQKGISKGEI